MMKMVQIIKVLNSAYIPMQWRRNVIKTIPVVASLTNTA